jgi:hypothetical protein
MLIEDIVKDTCTWLPEQPEFYLASMDWFNTSADMQEYWPVCLMENTTTQQVKVTSQLATDNTYKLFLVFLWNYPANNGEDLSLNPTLGSMRHTKVDELVAMAENFVNVLVKDTRLLKPSEAVTNVTISKVYNFMDCHLDGASLSIDIKKWAMPSCFPKHDGPKLG